jgi:O-acetylhomoserine (thiol)-lyase
MKDTAFSTKLIHTPYPKKDAHGALQMPVYLSSAFEFDDSEGIAEAFQGKRAAHAYSRSGNPSVEYFEQKIKFITGANAVLAVSSGMAAISATIMTICKAGDNIVTSKFLFGNTYSLFESTLKNYGIEFRYTDLSKPESIEKLIDKNTRALFFETITNPQIEVADVSVLSTIAKKNNILLIADTTLTPPGIFDAKKYGIDINILSSTKFISGGGTVVGGLIIDNGLFDWRKNPLIESWYSKFENQAFYSRLKKEIFRNTGACMSPMNAYLFCIGLETLMLRIQRSVDNAIELASWLQQQPKIKSVNYPGLKSSPFYEIAKKQFGDLPGALMAVDLHSENDCFKFQNKLNIIRRATNMNDNKSLIIHPWSTIYSEYSNDIKTSVGIRDTLLRLSVGIEDINDIKNDIEQALNLI